MPTEFLNLDVLKEQKSLTAVTRQNIDDILEHNKKLAAIEQKSDWGRHVASIPNAIYLQWYNELVERVGMVKFFGPEMDDYVTKKLADPDWKALRVDGPSHRMGYARNSDYCISSA